MKVNGFTLLAKMDTAKEERSEAKKDLTSQTEWYPAEGNEKPDVKSKLQRLDTADQDLLKVQSAIARYNQINKVEFEGNDMTLSAAIDMLGSLRSRSTTIASLSPNKGNSRYGLYSRMGERDRTKIYPESICTAEEVAELKKTYDERIAKLRTVIRIANSKDLEI